MKTEIKEKLEQHGALYLRSKSIIQSSEPQNSLKKEGHPKKVKI